MDCYECAKLGTSRTAVATCRSCSAGLCLQHLRDTAVRMQNGSVAPVCHHDTWVPARHRGPVAVEPLRPVA